MSHDHHKNCAIKLRRLWLVAFLLLGNIAVTYIEEYTGLDNITISNAPPVFLILVFFYVIFFSIPILLRMGYHAKHAKMRITLALSRIALVHHVAWILLGFIAVIFM